MAGARSGKSKRQFLIESIEPRVLLSKTIYVDVNASGATHDGTSWASAFVDLQQGLAVATVDDQIRVADGTYKPTSTTDRTKTFHMVDAVNLLGGYAGDGAPNPDARDVAAYVSILSGDIGTIGDNSDNSNHVVTATNVGLAAVLDGFTITGGNSSNDSGTGLLQFQASATITRCIFTKNVAPSGPAVGFWGSGSNSTFTECTFAGNSSTHDGGAVAIGNCSPTFTDCIFADNSSGASGGAVFNSNASPIFTRCTFSGNSGHGLNSGGGAMLNFGSSRPVLTDCVFSGNHFSGGGCGGAILNDYSNAKITGCEFTGNTSDSIGGAICNSRCSPTITACTFNENSGTGGGAIENTGGSSALITECTFANNCANGGGAIDNSVSSPIISNCTFEGNSAIYIGGAVINSGLSPVISNCRFSGNMTEGSGGAIYNSNSTAQITGCTLELNAADSGGAIAVNSSSPAITGCAFKDNFAATSGGGIRIFEGSPTVTSCTFQKNLAAMGGGVYSSGGGTISLCTINFNDADTGGGMFVTGTSAPTTKNCTFNGNSASSGAGIYFDSSSTSPFSNCVLVGNIADFSGGGVYNRSSTLTLAGCTLSANTALTGGGVYNLTTATLKNCVVWDNIATGGAQIYDSSGTSAVTYSDVFGGFGGTGNIDQDPIFARNPSPGPDVVWATLDDDFGDLRLQLTSPCIDAGSNAGVPSGISTDRAGFARIVDVPGVRDPNAIVDMGAYESWLNIYVDASATGTKSGLTWSSAFSDLSSALSSAIGGQQVRIAHGTYAPSGAGGRAASFIVPNDVAILGGYAGIGASNPDARDIALYATVLSGDIGIAGNTADNAYHVVTVTGGTTTRIDGLTVRDGNANGGGPTEMNGGGIYTAGGTPTVVNCILAANAASQRGGGVYSTSSDPLLFACILIGNSSGDMGGGVVAESGSLTLTNSVLIANAATAGAAVGSASSVTIANSIVWSNTADDNSQLFADGGVLNVSYCDIEDGWIGIGNINQNPEFVRNPAAGGDGVWGTADDDYGDLRIRSISPCIDTGNNVAVPVWATTDRVGKPRIADMPGRFDPGAIVDMGVFERVPPTASGAFLITPRPSVRMTFNIDVQIGSLAPADLVLFNRDTGEFIDSGVYSTVTYASTTRTATWQFSIVLPDGNYTATLPAGNVQDTTNSPLLVSDFNVEFFAFGGDANRDRIVDIRDLSILATNWQRTSRTFSQGDFNYDGKVDAADLGILSSHWQQALPPPPASAPASTVRAPTRTATRMVSVVG